MATPLDSTIFGPLFNDEEIASFLTDDAFVRALIEVEVALARAEARAGVIPASAAEQIATAQAGKIDVAALTKGTLRSGFPIIALVQELRKQVSAEAAPYVHWGATTQDIMDTACVLQLRAVVAVIKQRIDEIAQHLSALAETHRHTVLAGRTHGQQALPVTFGLKVAVWLAPLLRHAERLKEISPRLFVVQFGGAAGTLAALGDKGLTVTEELAKELNLTVPMMPWHAQRDNVVEFAGWLSLVTGSLAKMAQDIILMAQTEVGEVGESGEAGRGGSSTMPQKSNPITSELIVAAARTNAALLSALHQAQIQEHERATHGWQVEWLTLPQMVLLTGGALKHALYLAKNLQVDSAAMRANIVRANDVILAESAVFELAKALPRSEAEELVKKACLSAVAENKPLIEVVKKLAGDSVKKNQVDWPALADPGNYLGETEKIIDRVLKEAEKLLR
ncbi:MAG TPA: 3-carboxy-cis,cis-muconate cycloisomerase [Candidatus Saccharimonadales bacterium]|nr:3-carboxy-cis,cis-muconate cycloisomerase [Candidatus Saccharimonadales bacterium]